MQRSAWGGGYRCHWQITPIVLAHQLPRTPWKLFGRRATMTPSLLIGLLETQLLSNKTIFADLIFWFPDFFYFPFGQCAAPPPPKKTSSWRLFPPQPGRSTYFCLDFFPFPALYCAIWTLNALLIIGMQTVDEHERKKWRNQKRCYSPSNGANKLSSPTKL